MKIENWGRTADKSIYLYTLVNENNLKVSLTNIGAGIQSVFVKDKKGSAIDVVLGYDTAEGYLNDPFYIGTVVGRYANRIAGGKVFIEGKYYQLTVKDGGFHHHGGKTGFNKKIWDGHPFVNQEGQGVRFSLLSYDGEEGFPGNLEVVVTYILTDKDQLIITFEANTNKATMINFTQHTYFNLSGQSENVLEHQLMINSHHYLPVNHHVVPNGVLGNVKETPFDFTALKALGNDIDNQDEQLKLGHGYDHSWIINNKRSGALKFAAKVLEPKSGRILTVYTTEPGLHFYSGNWLNGSIIGKDDKKYQRYDGFCLETQNYPDAPNHPHFPSPVLKPNETFKSETIFEFSTL